MPSILLIAAVLLLGLAAPASAYNLADEAVRGPLHSENWRLKFGINEDVDSAADEDVWSAGGDCVWPAAAATTTVVSASADDTAAGTGCGSVTVLCLDDDLVAAPQTATLNGTAPVELTTDCRRATRAYCASAGSGTTNAGAIDIKHGATVIGQIPAGYGQSLMACDTVAAATVARLVAWGCSVTKTTTGVLRAALERRPSGGAWRAIETHELRTSGTGAFRRSFPGWQRLEAGTDIRVRARDVSANNMGISCNFDLLLVDEE